MSNSTIGKGSLITFTGIITPAYASPPVIYAWQFGDGFLSPPSTITSAISHTYPAAGTYIVSLTAASTYGQRSYTQTLVVHSPGSLPDPNNRTVFLPLLIKGF
jgi:PKD repeat protein